jgi:S-adenosylmethionine hydrolase
VSQRIITFTTDFGVSEHYVGAMKGVILSISPEVELVDISNSVQSFDILDAAITISAAYEYFPSETIHLVVVDPGVGTDRRPLLVSTTRHLFVAPDNGVLSLVYAREERVTVRHITAEHYFRQPVSQTFHGRDIFAAVAAHLSKGVEPAKFGEENSDFPRFAAPRPKPTGEAVKGVVIKVDKFGNLITNITPNDLPQLFEESPAGFRIQVGKADVRQMRTAYAQGAAGEFFAILGSMGYLEVACNRGSAAQLAGAGKGSEVTVTK